VQAKFIKHGIAEEIDLDGKGLFRTIGKKNIFTRYHSLVIDESTLPGDFEVTARATDGDIMGIRHKTLPIEGVQFHPESIASGRADEFFKAFLNYRREPLDVRGILNTLMEGKDLTRATAEMFMEDLTDGIMDERQMAGILTALFAKGPVAEEIAGCAYVLNKKKRRFPWWLLILLLLLLLLGGAAYYYFKIYRPSQPTAEYIPSQPVGDVPLVTDLTYNTDLLTYNERDIDQNSDMVCRYMTDYIYSFLAYRHYAGAMEPMMDRVHQYVQGRLGELMADRFAVQRLYPFNDYVYSHNEPYLHQVFAQHQRCKVQAELLDMKVLDGLLDKMVAELGLEPDANAPRAAEAQPVAAKPADKPAVAQAEEAPVRVNMEQNSKLGFDIIAGFYLDRATAARLTARLHELGSDAYIIEKNNMYYVSMGSAKNRTAAEALFKHIKSWYDGDIAIKQW
jgi:hypothetical protein